MLANPAAFRRTAAGLALIVAPVLFIIADAISPAWSDDTAEYLAEVADASGAYGVHGLLYVIAFTLMVPGVIGIVHLIRRRGVTLAHLGGALAVLGLGAFPALAATSIVDAIAVDAIARADHVALIDAFEDEAVAIVLLLVVLIPALLSLILIGAALWRSGLAPAWVGVLLIVAALLTPVGAQISTLVADALLLAGLGFVGVRMLRMDDDVWEHPPGDWRAVPPPPARPDMDRELAGVS
jgi:Domain of unknown function (DUF4386)